MALTLNNNLNSLRVGDYFWCKYTVTTANTVGLFSDIATKTDAEVSSQLIPVASSNLPNGYFKFIMVEDWNGKKRLIADRNIQHSISWDVLNTSGIASGSGLPVMLGQNNSIVFSIRLLTGGTVSTDKDNEWDRHIVNSTLNGAITAGDNNVWNWNNNIYSWTSTSGTASTTRANRGYTNNIVSYGAITSSDASTTRGFRPLLEIEILTQNKTLILNDGGYKKWSEKKDAVYKNITPVMTSNILPSPFQAIASSEYSATLQAWKAFDSSDTSYWNSTATGGVNQWVGMKLDKAYKIEKVTFVNNFADNYAIKDFKIQASNNDSEWIDITSGVKPQVKEHSLTFINNTAYQYWRIYVVSMQNATNTEVLVTDIKFYIVETPSSKAEWTTVSSTLPNSAQFLEQGVDNLSPLLDRKVTVLEPTQMVNKTDILLPNGEGKKVFKKTIDLKKYIDIRKIDIKTTK